MCSAERKFAMMYVSKTEATYIKYNIIYYVDITSS